MQVREFAERVLFATSLDEKLAPAPVHLVDTEPGKPMGAPGGPGRPVDLKLREDGVRADFPGDNPDVLQNDEQRGVLLHFLANHELLATELMALVLLKFPDAPSSFRKGIVRTLSEEQMHTKLYMDRMESCGIRFGELPVNRFFWDCIADMETPLDYVTRLSLTFEQANLDFSRHYADLFSKIGDQPTADILTRIYKDEISHVGYGLKWFRRWKSEGASDWDAYQKQLSFPLSPNRAKGSAPFNQEGRRLAGLDGEFIRGVTVAAQSKGRTPNVFVFNPSAEGFAAAGTVGGFHPGKSALALERDLETIPLFLGRRDDVVLTRRKQREEFLLSLRAAGFGAPEPVALGDKGEVAADSALFRRKLADLRPWAWSPESIRLLKPLEKLVTERRKGTVAWSDGAGQLYSKAFSADVLENLPINPQFERAWQPSAAGKECCSWEEVMNAVETFGVGNFVIKSAYGTAGRHCVRASNSDGSDFTDDRERLDSPGVRERVERLLSRRGVSVVVEPWLDRILDFSVQYEFFPKEQELRMLGATRLFNTPAGQFRACAVPKHLGQDMPEEIGRLLYGGGPSSEKETSSRQVRSSLFHHVYEEIIPTVLATKLADCGFRGPLGVDAFLYRDQSDGLIKLKLIVEINPRYTMGRVTLELAKQSAQRNSRMMEILTLKAVKRAGFSGFPAFAKHLAEKAPVEVTDERLPRMRSGSLCLNDPGLAAEFLAVYSMGDKMDLLI